MVRQQERILRAAWSRFKSGGLPAVTIRRVAADVGLAPMSLYRHFASRDALIEAMVARGLERFEVGYLRPVSSRGPALGRIRRLARAYIDFALAEPEAFGLVFLASRPSDTPFLRDYVTMTSTSLTMLQRAVEAAMDEGVIARADALAATVHIWAQLHGLVALYVTGRLGTGDASFRRFAERSLKRLLERRAPE